MPYLFIGAPIVGILTALAAVVAEQLLAAGANIFLQKEIVLDVYTHLGFFIVSAAVIEEVFKYFAASYILRLIFNFKRFKFIFASILSGTFFGLTEVYLILFTNGRKISEIGTLSSDTLFSLLTVVIIHVLTIFLISILIAVHDKEKRLNALKVIIFPIFIHLLYNFLIIQKGNLTNWLVSITLAVVFLAGLFILFLNFRDLD